MLYNAPYNPSVEYYFLDYYMVEDCRWVRVPYMTFQEVATRIEYLDYTGVEIRDLRITPEKMLDEKRDAQFNEEKQEYVKDTITVREYLFNRSYQEMSDRYKERSTAAA